MNISKLLSIIFFFILSQQSLGQAAVSGKVTDAVSNEPIPFANIVVSETTQGTVSDEQGLFRIEGLKPGFIRLEASFIGYKKAITGEIKVNNSSVPFVEIKLEKTDTELQEVRVQASPFRKTKESPVSLRSIGVGEIERSPGANRDISKVIQSFPGVQSTPAYRNDIIIRGGGPSESRFYLDGVEVPFINHFSTQGASGGPVGIINADFVREVKLYSGAFPASRGNALSGVMEFEQADGNNEKLHFQGTVGASEIATTLDGPVGDKTTYIFSVRHSYLQFLFKALELPFLPTFTDMQFKVRTRFDKNNELTIIGLGANDLFELNTDIENPDEQQIYILDRIPVNEQWSYTLGAVYKHYHKNSYQTLVLSRSHLNNSSIKYRDNDESSPDNKILNYLSEEIENKLRFEHTARFDGFKLNAGTNLEFINYRNNTQQQRYYNNQPFYIDYSTDLDLIKFGLFAQLSKSIFDERLALSFGLRADGNNYSTAMKKWWNQLSPRFSASFALNPQWSLNANTGRYYQLPAYTTLGFQNNGIFVNKTNNLKYIAADHYIAGIEFRPQKAVQFTGELFWKNYSDYPLSVNDGISLANKGADFGVVGDEEVKSVSKGRAYGSEFQLRISHPGSLNLNLAYTLVRSEFTDSNGNYIPSSWDSKHLLTFTSTKEMKRNWRIGTRWRFVGGLPYTPWDLEKSALIEAWNLQGGAYFDYAQLNAKRFKPFHQLDIRIDKTYYMRRTTARFYIDIQNLYNHQAEQNDIVIRATDEAGNYLLSSDGTKYQLKTVKNTSGTVLPTIGISIEF